jgi:hypothetical protein
VFLLEEQYRLELLDAESSFIARLIERIKEPETDFGLVWRKFHEGKR